jgi:hypothetical protein
VLVFLSMCAITAMVVCIFERVQWRWALNARRAPPGARLPLAELKAEFPLVDYSQVRLWQTKTVQGWPKLRDLAQHFD